MNTVKEVQPGIGTPSLDQNQVSHSVRGKRSSFVRHSIWLNRTIGFSVNVRVRFSPGSITIILWTRTNWWSLSVRTGGYCQHKDVGWNLGHYPSSLNRVLGVKTQLFNNPVVVGPFHGGLPKFPIFLEMTRQGVLRQMSKTLRYSLLWLSLLGNRWFLLRVE